MADFDPTTPSIARVYDFLLGGKDNFAVDRAMAERLLAVAPVSADVMRENRQFLARAARWAAGKGITQFVDLGCGMPTAPNTHSSVRQVSVPGGAGHRRRAAVAPGRRARRPAGAAHRTVPRRRRLGRLAAQPHRVITGRPRRP